MKLNCPKMLKFYLSNKINKIEYNNYRQLQCPKFTERLKEDLFLCIKCRKELLKLDLEPKK